MEKTLTRSRKPRSRVSFIFSIEPTGTPLFPIEYHKYPASAVPGEVAAAEQPLPILPAPYARQLLSEDLLTNRTPEAHQWALEKFRKLPQRGTIRSLQRGKRHSGLSRIRRRRGVGRPGGRSGDGNYLCELERNGMDRCSRAQHGGEQRSGYLLEPVRGLPRRKNDGFASCHSCAGGSWRSPGSPADCGHHHGRKRKDARIPQSLGRSDSPPW